ncbi:ProQ/FINO family protein [Paraburkholderia tropica]|uniref:ProQ/FINO family protein n=1 Tax=Paraburkholderia tropica TaxID=92647 RepID=A0ABX5MKZ7_9BURK|nr:ProQ/FINO family protein [Paraburkholderia tropica]MDE1138689.1 ProQ/FINO family protein [Paraburkholderia tropica]PXX14198.1 ProQ/FINO family protein [Paraburkholderia tropica]PZW79034.1 ProQ/FINO family protein [Paraburkholderia tropica]
MKAASQQRRTLSFKDGLLEIKKSMGMGTGQPPEEQAQSPQGKSSPKGAQGPRRRQGASGHKGPKGPRPAGAEDARARGPRPAHGKPQGKRAEGGAPAGGRPQEGKGQQARPQRGPRDGEQRQGARPGQGQGEGRGPHRQRPARAQQPAANLSEADKARIERNRQLNTVWNVFAKLYPTFRERLPLKIGVVEDLVAAHPDYERTLIVAVLKRHVNHPRYHERVAAGGPRYELDGTASEGPGIDPSHIGRANAALARQKAKAEAQAKPQDAAAPAAPAAGQTGEAAEAVESAEAQAPAPAVEAQAAEPAAPESAQAPAAPAAEGDTPAANA